MAARGLAAELPPTGSARFDRILMEMLKIGMNHTFVAVFAAWSLLWLLPESARADVYREEKNEGISLLPSGKLTISGYLQVQYQYGQKDATLDVGGDRGDAEHDFSRLGVRRGRVKLTYRERLAGTVLQIDVTEKGLSLKDAYVEVRNPWWLAGGLQAGVFNRPFGYEISHSSSRREEPERATVFRMLFPQERDLGAKIVMRAPQTSPWHCLMLEAAVVAGNGIKSETDSRKDFIGRLSVERTPSERVAYGAGVSYYNGGVYQGTERVYEMEDGMFVLHQAAANKGNFAKREYFGCDLRVCLNSVLGQTQLRGELLAGTQPGTLWSSESPNHSELPADDTYIRRFFGGYIVMVHRIGHSAFALVTKFDWYDPNTKVSGSGVGSGGTGVADMYQQALGVGALCDISRRLRVSAYYDFVSFEPFARVEALQNAQADKFTLRLQYSY